VLPFGGPPAHYRAVKAALDNFSKALAMELALEKIRVNLVTPGPVITPGPDNVGIPIEKRSAGKKVRGSDESDVTVPRLLAKFFMAPWPKET
jgi:NAD(P)-dependent dehydrogenase (short-subunit alcohol dehydrogenase family)